MWRSVLLHEFPDANIANFGSLAGTLTPPSRRLVVGGAQDGAGSVGFAKGNVFELELARPLDQIVGVSLRARVRLGFHPLLATSAFHIAAGAELDLRTRRTGLALGNGRAEADAVVAGFAVPFGRLQVPWNRPVDLRYDWHTSGQARLLLDGRLVGYRNGVAPGAQVTIDRVWFGMPGPTPTTLTAKTRRFTVSRVFVRALARDDALGEFGELFPPVAPSLDNLVVKCRLAALSNLLAVVDRMRGFMASVHQTLSQPWTEVAGPAAGPFQPAAVRAHEVATQSVVALVGMVRSSDYSQPERFLGPFTEFLTILHGALPTQFEALAAELAHVDVVPPNCAAPLEPDWKTDRMDLEPLLALLKQATERLHTVAGVV